MKQIKLLVSVVLGVLPTCSVGLAYADAEQEFVEIRGERKPVWPVADLRERGFDVLDIPRDENAAWIYIEACNTYLDLPHGLFKAFDYALRHGWPDNNREFRKWLTRKENRQAIKLARQASHLDRCQIPYFGDPEGPIISVLLSNLSSHRMLAKLMVADGRRLIAQKDYRGAMGNFTVAMRMGHHMAQGITLIEGLVGVACWNCGNHALRDMVLRYDVPKQDLAAIHEEWKKLRPLMPTMQRGFEGERVCGPAMVDDLVCRPTKLFHNITTVADPATFNGYLRPRNGWDRLEARLGQVFLPDRTIKRHMTEYYDALIETASLPYYDERGRSFDENKYFQNIPQWDVFCRILLPSLSRARLLGVRTQVETRATTIMMALRLHACQNRGKYPLRLDDLSVEIDADELIDPFSGGEFNYTRTSSRWQFYSFGPDGVDHGGKPGDRWDSKDSDIAWKFPPDPVEPLEEE